MSELKRGTPGVASPAPAAVPRRPWLALFAGVIAFSAYGGGVGLIVGYLSIGDLDARLPFASPVLGGIALLLIVAVPNTWLSWLAWRGDASTSVAAVTSGVLLIGWILVEYAFIREFSFFHPLYLAFGVVLLIVGWRGLDTARRVT